MNKQVINLLKNTWGLLIFALISGLAYYAIVQSFIFKFTKTGGGLLGFFFFPAIVCGAALIIVKLVKQNFEAERENAALMLFWLHIALILVSIVFAVAMILPH